MIDRVTGGKRLPAAVRQQVVARTDGVPLFVEELTKMVLESGLLQEQADHYELLGPLPSLAIPTTLHDSLMARLDRLTNAKDVAQLGAILGRTFPYELLQAVSPWNEERLQHALTRLVDAELLHQRGVPPQVTYIFKHTLVQETAYQSLLKSKRQQYHQQTAYTLEQRFPEIATTQPELLAYHYTEAALPMQALPYWQRAGQHAVERSANVEAISHFTKGLELLKPLPEAPERAQQELTLQLAMGSPLLMLKGHTAPEVEHAYARAYELAQQIGDGPQRFSALVGLWRFYFSQSRLERARELAEQCFTLAQRLQDVRLLQEAHMALGSTFLHLGEYVAARASLEQGIALYDPEQCRILAFSRGTDPGVVCLARVAWTLWMLGYAEQALERSREALALAQDISHAYSLAFALHFAGLIHQCRREVQIVQEWAEAEMALSNAQGFDYWLEGGMIRHGWALVQQGVVEEGITQLRQGLDSWLARGNDLGKTHVFARLAETYGKAGQTAEGLGVLAEALAAVRNNAEHLYEAELYRLKGELLLQSGVRGLEPEGRQSHMAEVEACFRQALDIARHQQAKSLELRATMSLVRLWQAQGKHAEACQMLTGIYGWFTEGFDTPDLQEAKALLAALQ
jgi:tetratricopeptide (TPR) repeat protein